MEGFQLFTFLRKIPNRLKCTRHVFRMVKFSSVMLQSNERKRLHQDSIAASTAKQQNTPSENTDTTYTARDAKVTRDIKYDIKTLNIKDYT